MRKPLHWYETDSSGLIVALMIIFLPLGLWSMWRHSKWPLKVKLYITGIIIFIAFASSPFEKQLPVPTSSAPSAASSEEAVKLEKFQGVMTRLGGRAGGHDGFNHIYDYQEFAAAGKRFCQHLSKGESELDAEYSPGTYLISCRFKRP